MDRTTRITTAVLAACLSLPLVTGCASSGSNSRADRGEPPQQDRGPDIGESGEAWLRSTGPIDALNDLVDSASQDLVNRLSTNEGVNSSDYQLVMLVDEFSDLTGARNTGLRQALKSVHRTLSRNERLRNDFVFLASSEASVEDLLEDVSGSQSDWDALDPFGEAPSTAPSKYHPDYIYTMQGEMSAVRDFAERRIMLVLRIDVVHPRTRQLVESFELHRPYIYTRARGWVPEE